MNPTPEQLFCIFTAKHTKRTKINAVAGSGKTSTLTLIAKEIIQPSLYLAFNKVTATEAAEKFPKHVTCRTTHSIAYEAFGKDMNHKLSRPKGKYVNVAGTSSEIGKYYKIHSIDTPTGETISQAYLGLMIKTAVQRYEQSADFEMTSHHLPWGDLKEIESKYEIKASLLSKDILKYAKMLWKDRINLCSVVLATHDTYLKMWQLSKPTLKAQVIYLDEAQDTTPCVLDVVLRQTDSKIILVGDNRQNIYGWRGSVNAMETTEAAACGLSKSFRYGQAIADVATAILGNTVDVFGREDINSIVGDNVVDTRKPYTVLCRTNACLLDSAVSDIVQGLSVAIEIDVRDFVKVLESSLALFKGEAKNIKHEKVIPYATWDAFIEESQNGGEFSRIAKIILQGRSGSMIELLNSYTVPKHPHVTYTTAHRSKGREFSQVVLAEDFPSNYSKKGAWIGLPTEEQNLLYVAATRAIDVLEVNDTVKEIQERYAKPILTKQYGAENDLNNEVGTLVCSA